MITDPPARAGVAHVVSVSLFVPSGRNSAPAWRTWVVPASSRQNTLPPYPHGEAQNPRALGIRSFVYAALPVTASKQLMKPPFCSIR